MGRKFKLTEDQYRKLQQLNENDVEVTASAGGNASGVANAAQQAAKTASQAGVNTVKITDVNSNTSGQASQTFEGKILSKKQLEEARIQILKEKSVVLTPDQLFPKK